MSKFITRAGFGVSKGRAIFNPWLYQTFVPTSQFSYHYVCGKTFTDFRYWLLLKKNSLKIARILTTSLNSDFLTCSVLNLFLRIALVRSRKKSSVKDFIVCIHSSFLHYSLKYILKVIKLIIKIIF